MFREVYLTVADLPKSEWPVAKLKHLSELRKHIGGYEAEMSRRKLPPAAKEPAKPSRPADLFLRYSHADEPQKNTLEKHIALLQRIGLIDSWSDRALAPGQEWDAEIRSWLQEADIILFLVSANFLASDYAYTREVLPALGKARSGTATVVPIILSPVDWKLAPFSEFQALPRNAQPISTWANQDEAWAQVSEGIRQIVQSKGLGL
jgi:hypothetical protein